MRPGMFIQLIGAVFRWCRHSFRSTRSIEVEHFLLRRRAESFAPEAMYRCQ